MHMCIWDTDPHSPRLFPRGFPFSRTDLSVEAVAQARYLWCPRRNFTRYEGTVEPREINPPPAVWAVGAMCVAGVQARCAHDFGMRIEWR